MEKGIQIFSNPQFGEIRTTTNEENEPMFCAADVCKSLGYSNPRDAVSKHVEEDDVAKRDTLTKGGNQLLTYVSESGLYALIFGSKLESAKAFKKWVTSEVLPSIRRQGGYIAARADESDAEIMAKALMIAKSTIERKNREIEMRDTKIAEDAPKVTFAEAIVGSRSSCLVGELAKIITQNGYTIGQNTLFGWLRENNYLGKQGERYNIPNQRYIEMGLFEVKKTVHDQHGVLVTKSTPKVTGKGQQYFINKFLGR